MERSIPRFEIWVYALVAALVGLTVLLLIWGAEGLAAPARAALTLGLPVLAAGVALAVSRRRS